MKPWGIVKNVIQSITFLNQHNLQEHTYLISKDECSPYPSSETLLLQQVETTTGCPDWSKCKEELTYVHTCTTQPRLRFRKHHGKGSRKTVRTRDQDVCYAVVSSRPDRKAAPITSQQYGCLDICTTATPVDMPTHLGEISQGSAPRQRATSS